MASEFLNGDEIKVVEILVQMSEIILRRDLSSSEFIPGWGFKRRRSIPRPQNDDHNDAVSPKIKDEATSPETPLSYSLSESDSKRLYLKRKSLHRHKEKREDLIEKIDELTQRRDLMLSETEKVRIYYDKLKADNLDLKARKEKFISTELKRQTPDQGLYNPPLNLDPTVNIRVHNLPDLNIAVESFESFEYPMVNDRDKSRAMATEARQKRIQICRAKKSHCSL